MSEITTYKYLHRVSSGNWFLDSKLRPEVSAMLAAMASRAPLGGIQARYTQLVEAVAGGLYEEGNENRPRETHLTSYPKLPPWGEVKDKPEYRAWYSQAEDRLCEYPLHPKVQKFFDDFVLRYGHSSILELTGSPAVYTESVSWLTAYLLFDSPLCAGQEFSTRAVQHRDWPMARECYVTESTLYEGVSFTMTTTYGDTEGILKVEDVSFMFGGAPKGEPKKLDVQMDVVKPHPDLAALHNDWFEVFEAEVKWWTDHLTDPANRAALGIADKEPFRPALDRARWALPGTIATGCAHTSNLRERARVLRDGTLLAKMSNCVSAVEVWEGISATYREALPGLAGMGLREAVYEPGSGQGSLPWHLFHILTETPDGPDAEVTVYGTTPTGLAGTHAANLPARAETRTYLDASWNQATRVGLTFRCSLAVARDWHRHRTMYPWHLQVVRDGGDRILIDPHYEPKSDLAREKTLGLLRRSTQVFDAFIEKGNRVQAALALPLGTRVALSGQGGLRDAVYTLELRRRAPGACFEYQDQALQALAQLRDVLPSNVREALLLT